MGEFEVEKILFHRDIAKTRQYFVSWVGYPDSENMWINQEDMDCTALLENYLKNLQNKKFESKNLHSQVTTTTSDEIDKSGKKILTIVDGFKELKGTFYNVLLSDNTKVTLDADEARKACPKLLIKFLQERIKT